MARVVKGSHSCDKRNEPHDDYRLFLPSERWFRYVSPETEFAYSIGNFEMSVGYQLLNRSAAHAPRLITYIQTVSSHLLLVTDRLMTNDEAPITASVGSGVLSAADQCRSDYDVQQRAADDLSSLYRRLSITPSSSHWRHRNSLGQPACHTDIPTLTLNPNTRPHPCQQTDVVDELTGVAPMCSSISVHHRSNDTVCSGLINENPRFSETQETKAPELKDVKLDMGDWQPTAEGRTDTRINTLHYSYLLWRTRTALHRSEYFFLLRLLK